MYLRAVIENRKRPKYGEASIPFPIEMDRYEDVLDILKAMDIGDALKADCGINRIQTTVPILELLEGQKVNIDELDYLCKRLDSFDKNEIAQFQAEAYKLGLTNMRDLINLTFCCQQVTVITDFSDLGSIGRRHFVVANGGATQQELDILDGEETALLLIGSNAGGVTPYGVLYENGMKLEKVYQGHVLPHFSYTTPLLTLELLPTERDQADTFLDLPASDSQIARTLIRAGISQDVWCGFHVDANNLPDSVRNALAFEREYLADLNDMCQAISQLDEVAMKKMDAAVQMAKPASADDVRVIVENLDQFDYIPNVTSPEELGKYMIRESGRYEYDPNLEDFYNYGQYGADRVAEESGQFTEQGYIAYKGETPLEQLLSDCHEQQGMGGMS